MAQIHPALGASARMTWKVVSFPLIAGLLLLKPVVDAVCAFVLVFGLVAPSPSSFPPWVRASRSCRSPAWRWGSDCSPPCTTSR